MKNYKLSLSAGFFGSKSNPKKKKHNEKKCTCNLSVCGNVQNVHLSKIPSILTVIYRNIVPKMISLVNIKIAPQDKTFVKLGVIKATANQAAEKSLEIAEKALSHGLVKNRIVFILL